MSLVYCHKCDHFKDFCICESDSSESSIRWRLEQMSKDYKEHAQKATRKSKDSSTGKSKDILRDISDIFKNVADQIDDMLKST